MPYLSGRKIIHPFYSTVSGTLIGADTQLGPEYWRRNLELPVLFHAGMQRLLNDRPEVTTIVEIGPHSALRGPLLQILKARSSKSVPTYIPTLVRDKDSAVSIVTTVGQLHARGHHLDFSFINPTASVLNDLPNYPWDHDRDFWKESRLSMAWRLRKHPHHELLGSKCVETTDFEHTWRNVLRQYDVPWLGDHKLGSNIIFPCAGYIAMMGEAIRQVLGSGSYILRYLTVKSALVIPEAEATEIMTTMKPLRLTGLTNSPTWYEFSVSAFNGSCWVETCLAQGRVGDEINFDRKQKRRITPQTRKIPDSYFYDYMQYLGLKYGPRFRALEDISAHTERDLAVGALKNDESKHEATYAVHPTALDCCIQLAVVAKCRGIVRRLSSLWLPLSIQHIAVRPGGPDLVAEATIDPETHTANVLAIAKEGHELVVNFRNWRFIPFDTGDDSNKRDTKHAARIVWLPDIDCLDASDLIKCENSKRHLFHLIERIAVASIFTNARHG